MELLIVIAIVGIIAAVVIPNVYSFRITGEVVAANKELENVKTAALAYYAEHSQWPTTSGVLSPFLAGNITSTYTFNANFGWVMNASGGWDTELNWQSGVAGVNGTHGKWIR